MSKTIVNGDANWWPTAPLENLKRRADLYRDIRAFFAAREVLEVETPVLSMFGVTDVHLDNIVVPCRTETRFLQTSPEYAMKRLLAAYGVSIFQISKAFRPDEAGALHNPEFTMLEWYRIGFNHHELMDEIDALLQFLLSSFPAERYRYQEIFEKYIGFNPHRSTHDDCVTACRTHKINLSRHAEESGRDALLGLLMSEVIEPHLGIARPTFIYDYPSSQAALARRSPQPPCVGERFELYLQGIEIANGFHELTDVREQKDRFIADQAHRKAGGIRSAEADTRLLDALEYGLPACAGVALGIDRLLMVLAGETNMARVLSFDWNHA